MMKRVLCDGLAGRIVGGRREGVEGGRCEGIYSEISCAKSSPA
jgi:hypothetical protein